jgi:DNA polymerase V
LKNKNSIFIPETDQKTERPVFMVPVSAGFPSPAEDYVEGSLDLNRHLIKHPAATFFVRVSGNSMVNAGIYPGDILIVDRSLEAVNNKIVIAVLNGELTVKRLKLKNSEIYLFPENPDYSPIKIEENSDFEIWGVATNVIHSL